MRATWLLLIGIVVLSLALAEVPYGARAWSNGGFSADPDNPDYGTHDWIADLALAWLPRNVSFLTTTYHARFLLGTEAPDNPAYIGDPQEHHVYYRANGALQDDSSAVRAEALYANALGFLRSGDLDEAAYCIGAMTHYISDVGVFGHTMGAHTDWGAEVHHSDYEDYVLAHPQPMMIPLSIRDGLSAREATLLLAQNVTFGYGFIQPNYWMDSHYSWTDSIFSTSANNSEGASVLAVAKAINNLMIEAGIIVPSAPSAPTALKATWTKGTGVILTWTASAGADTYEIYRGESLGDQQSVTTVGGTTWTDTSAAAGRTYYYWVKASGAGGSSELSAPASATVPAHGQSLLVPVAAGVIASLGAAGLSAIIYRRKR